MSRKRPNAGAPEAREIIAPVAVGATVSNPPEGLSVSVPLGRMYLPAVTEIVGRGESTRSVTRLADPIVEMGGRPVPAHGGERPRYLVIADPPGEGEISPEMARNLEAYHGYKRVAAGDPEPADPGMTLEAHPASAGEGGDTDGTAN
jgi:hypothetical protein